MADKTTETKRSHWHERAQKLAVDSATFTSTKPATGAAIAEVASAGAADVDRAVTTARAAFTDSRWRKQPDTDRKALLLRLADLIEGTATNSPCWTAWTSASP